MSRQEISQLRSFKIVNQEFGEIEFLAPKEGIDLTYVDLQAFEIRLGMALGYDDLEGKFEKAAINTKLNIPAIVTLRLSKDVREQKLLNIISRQNEEDTERINGQA